ncbi:hypothetical protein MQ964_001897, partial [Campylobacter upsaliensis]|nr:hypothetical protein [Campylobacter upsaliensis]
MKKIKKIKKILSLIFITTPLFLFAKGGNVLSTLEQDFNTQITEAGSSIA